MEKRLKYLKEDEDILDELNKLDPSIASVTKDERDNRLSRLQIEATLRNRKSLEESNKQSSRTSFVLLIFALIQIVIMLFQFIFSAQTSNSKIFGIILITILLMFIYYILRRSEKEIKNKKSK